MHISLYGTLRHEPPLTAFPPHWLLSYALGGKPVFCPVVLEPRKVVSAPKRSANSWGSVRCFPESDTSEIRLVRAIRLGWFREFIGEDVLSEVLHRCSSRKLIRFRDEPWRHYQECREKLRTILTFGSRRLCSLKLNPQRYLKKQTNSELRTLV